MGDPPATTGTGAYVLQMSPTLTTPVLTTSPAVNDSSTAVASTAMVNAPTHAMDGDNDSDDRLERVHRVFDDAHGNGRLHRDVFKHRR